MYCVPYTPNPDSKETNSSYTGTGIKWKCKFTSFISRPLVFMPFHSLISVFTELMQSFWTKRPEAFMNQGTHLPSSENSALKWLSAFVLQQLLLKQHSFTMQRSAHQRSQVWRRTPSGLRRNWKKTMYVERLIELKLIYTTWASKSFCDARINMGISMKLHYTGSINHQGKRICSCLKELPEWKVT